MAWTNELTFSIGRQSDSRNGKGDYPKVLSLTIPRQQGAYICVPRAPRGFKWLSLIPRGALKKREMRGDCAGGALASGSSKFPAEGFGIKRAAPPPKSFQKALQNPQN